MKDIKMDEQNDVNVIDLAVGGNMCPVGCTRAILEVLWEDFVDWLCFWRVK